jgi:hypothetical protein
VKKRTFVLMSLLFCVAVVGAADEGMWMPQQIPLFGEELKARGLQLDPNAFADLTGHPMGAIISLGGCSASFVSPQGLIVTNHHCAYGALQFNSTPQNDLITNGFLARTMAEEISAGAGSRVFVTTDIEDVTVRVTGNIPAKTSDVERQKLIERRQKEIVDACEKEPGVRCRVASFFEGAQYQRTRQMEIRDVRLVYAPPLGIGEFGGETDNWMWPRHTGDWTFLRAYVGADGRPADFSADNVPYQPKQVLKVSTEGIDEGDLVFVAGYPGRTFRYRTSDEIAFAEEYSYPTSLRYMTDVIAILEKESEGDKQIEIRNASRLKGLYNSLKNTQGTVEGLRRGRLVEQRRELEKELSAWIAADPKRAREYGDVFGQIAKLNEERYATRERDTVLMWLYRGSPMLSQANTIYRLSVEQQKKNDLDRRAGYQQRDVPRIREAVERAQRSLEPRSDRAVTRYVLTQAAKLPAGQRIPAIDAALAATGESDPAAQIEKYLDLLYGGTKIGELEARKAMIGGTPAQLRKLDDPFVNLATGLHAMNEQSDLRNDRLEGAMSRVRPQYVAALRELRGGRLYPDANSTLRVTFGTVTGYSPRDAVKYEPQTDVRGILEKESGTAPFASPANLLEAIRTKKFGSYVDEVLGTVPVNFLSSVDTTGGNSGSPTLNAKGELNGLLFDGNYESMASSYLVDPAVTRSIHVDAVYMLWVMDAVDRAHHLLREMGLPVEFE